MPDPRTEAGRQLAASLGGEEDRIRAVESEAGNYALTWTLEDMKAERNWLLLQQEHFGRAEWAMVERIEAAIVVLDGRLRKIPVTT